MNTVVGSCPSHFQETGTHNGIKDVQLSHRLQPSKHCLFAKSMSACDKRYCCLRAICFNGCNVTNISPMSKRRLGSNICRRMRKTICNQSQKHSSAICLLGWGCTTCNSMIGWSIWTRESSGALSVASLNQSYIALRNRGSPSKEKPTKFKSLRLNSCKCPSSGQCSVEQATKLYCY